MSFIEWYEWEWPVILEVTEQRPMNNEYANSWISKLSPVTLIESKTVWIINQKESSMSKM